MWLLSTDRAELKRFSSPEAVKEPYAILSHRWVGQEQEYKAVQRIMKKCTRTDPNRNPRDLMSDKIRRACELAESHGHKWIWIDTCCIDKSSSAELSEAINSMYRYYALAEICYVYLHDVAEDARGSAIFVCEWITRGWTLQELLAPKVVVFLNRAWQLLGTKGDFAVELQQCTDIPTSILRLEKELCDFSIAERMSWASRRQTERVEDQAYSLFGIFDINMPTLYGEGSNAFQRLQEEMMHRSPDTTLFAWGNITNVFGRPHSPNGSGESSNRVGLLASRMTSFQKTLIGDISTGLFASGPCDFVHCGRVRYSPPRLKVNGHPADLRARPASNAWTTSSRVPGFRLTPYGVLSEMPLIEYDGVLLGDLYWVIEPLGLGPRQRCFLLINDRPEPRSTVTPTYYTGVILSKAFGMSRTRVLCMTQDEYANLLQVNTTSFGSLWKEFYLVPQTPLRRPSNRSIPSNNSLYTPFRISQPTIDQLLADVPELSLVSIEDSDGIAPWAKEMERAMRILLTTRGDVVVIIMGQCSLASSRAASRSPRCSSTTPTPAEAWAVLYTLRKMDIMRHEVAKLADVHDCSRDHISKWDNMTKTFRIALPSGSEGVANSRYAPGTDLFIALSFSPCLMNPGHTLVLQLKAVMQERQVIAT